MPTLDASLLLLCGGAGRRMGAPKALVEFRGTRLVDHLAGRLGPAFAEVLVSVARPGQFESPMPGRLVADRRPGLGPIGGIEAGLAAAVSESVLVVACDLPLVSPALAGLLVAALRASGALAAIPVVGGRPQPVCAAYSRRAAPVLARLLEAGERRAVPAALALDPHLVAESEWMAAGVSELEFSNVNTPAELATLAATLDADASNEEGDDNED